MTLSARAQRRAILLAFVLIVFGTLFQAAHLPLAAAGDDLTALGLLLPLALSGLRSSRRRA